MDTRLFRVVALLAAVLTTSADITGTNPPNNACICFNNNSVNIRSTPCGNVIGSANNGQCYRYSNAKQSCVLSGITYEFFRFNYGGADGWAAGIYLDLSADSRCATSGEGYQCAVTDQGRRVHETTSPTPFDCRDGGCGNSCQGGQCVAYVTCRCTRNGNYAPNTGCWRPGTRVRGADGRCNRAIAVNTAIATFDNNGNYYAGHAAVFAGCQDDYTIRAYDQWCCRSIGYSTYPSSHSYFGTFAVITNPSCAYRTSWNCRFENAGPTCCPTSVAGCLNNKYWWQPFVESTGEEHMPSE